MISPTAVRAAGGVAVVLLAVATGVASHEQWDARPHPVVLQTSGSMQVSPIWVRHGDRLRVRFTTGRARFGALALLSRQGSYVLAGGRVTPIPADGEVSISTSRLRPRPLTSFATRVPAELPAGRYRACSIDAPTAGAPVAECVPLTVLSG